MTEVLQFFGDLAELAGPILILAGISSGPAIGALIGTLAGALSVVVGQGLQELAQTESQILPNIPSSPPLVTTSNTASSSVTQVTKNFFREINVVIFNFMNLSSLSGFCRLTTSYFFVNSK